MRGYRLAVRMLLGLGLLALADCAEQATVTTSQAQIPSMEPGTARVWFLRQSYPLSGNGNVEAGTPMIFANGAPVGRSEAGAAFFRDFPPGTYKFTVEPYGLPTGQADTVQLAAGTQTYLQVQWIPSWVKGYPEAGWGFGPNTFGILTMSPQVAQPYLSVMTYLGQR